MDYTRIVRNLRERLDFMNDDATADGAARAVLGLLAMRMDRRRIQMLAQTLPGIDFEALRANEERERSGAGGDYVTPLERRFRLNRDQARQVVVLVLQAVKEGLSIDEREELEQGLPEDLAEPLPRV